MTHKINEQEALNVLEALATSVEDMSDEEIAEQFRLEGRDPDAEAEELRQDLLDFVTEHQRQALHEQHTQARRQLTHSAHRVPGTITERRARLRRVLERAPADLTVQGRNLEEIPDEEVDDWLADLAALGYLDDEG